MSFFVLWRRWKASCQSVIIAFWSLSISHFSNWSDRFQSRDKFVLQFPEKFCVPFAFVASSGFSFPPQTTKAQRDQIKWHMNNGVFFIFNFPQVLLLMTIVFFFQVTPQLKPAITSFFFKRSHLLTWMAATWKIRLWFSVTFRLFFFCEILYMTCLLRPKKKLR